jgi:hypothetical protein
LWRVLRGTPFFIFEKVTMKFKAFGLIAALSIVAPPAPGLADQEQPLVAQIGDAACRVALFGSEQSNLGPNHYRRFIEKASVDTEVFCGCVADEFVANEDLQTFRMDMAGDEQETEQVFREILVENLEACLPAFNALPREVQQAILAGDEGVYEDPLDGDLVEWEQDGIDWMARPHFSNCVLVAEDVLDVPEYDREGLNEWFAGSGLTADDLCECVNATLEEAIAGGVLEFTGTPDQSYWDKMQGSVAECSIAMWNGRQ